MTDINVWLFKRVPVMLSTAFNTDASVLNQKDNTACLLSAVRQPDKNPHVKDVTDNILIIAVKAVIRMRREGLLRMLGTELPLSLTRMSASPALWRFWHCKLYPPSHVARMSWNRKHSSDVHEQTEPFAFTPAAVLCLSKKAVQNHGRFTLLPWTDALKPDNFLISSALKWERRQVVLETYTAMVHLLCFSGFRAFKASIKISHYLVQWSSLQSSCLNVVSLSWSGMNRASHSHLCKTVRDGNPWCQASKQKVSPK